MEPSKEPTEAPVKTRPAPRPVPARFLVSKRTLHFDRFMTSAIVFGGLGIVVAVFGIFGFILSQIIPLFGKAHIRKAAEIPMAYQEGGVLGLDEWSELPFFYDGGSEIAFYPMSGTSEAAEPRKESVGLPEGAVVSAYRYDAVSQTLIVGTADGRAGLVKIGYSAAEVDGKRAVTAKVESQPFLPLNEATPAPVRAIDYKDSGDRKLFAVIQGDGAGARVGVVTLRQQRSLLGKGTVKVEGYADLTDQLDGSQPVDIRAAGTADSLIVRTEANELFYLFLSGDQWTVRQRFTPFEGTGETVAGLGYLFGDVSLVVYSTGGRVRIYSLFIKEGEKARTFGLTKELHPLRDGITHYFASQRNKSFLVANDHEVALCYATTESVRKTMELPFRAGSLAMDAKAEHAGFIDREAGRLHLFEIDDPHPEAGWRAFFAEIWYEGFAKPKYEWQSTSGTDDFEPKLSLTPLIIGSLKGTLYAMLFAVPIAVLAAIYVSQFMHPDVKRLVKPLMEIMASLPSVVLGFLAALWLAPLIEARVPSVLTIIVLIPVVAALIGYAWSHTPVSFRNRMPMGGEYLILIPAVLAAGWIGWNLGPAVERQLFVATMPGGERIADFRLWWPQFSGLPYDQRNCLVVGFMMGFAVIPVIFTIAEDALSNVPPSIISASEALGASRWQVVRTVVLPIAAAGIFSALMIGLGRAVGETMIVVMATGNTPVMDEMGRLLFGEAGIGNGQFPIADHWNLFNGMRTLSANIAVELPEAAVGSTHYRSLFLGALMLFLMTFVLNTVAEVLRQRLREKFKIV